MKNHLNKISLYVSEACNLNCKYCVISKSLKGKKDLQLKKQKESLEKGEYIDHLKTIFEKQKFDPLKITKLELWGEETTLTVNNFLVSFSKLNSYFPNIESIFFSTNAIGNAKTLSTFIKKLDEEVRGPFSLSIQLSCDGFLMEKTRGVSYDTFKENIINLFTQLNEIKLNNLKVEFNVHSVISRILIHELLNSNNVEKHWKSLDDITDLIKSININPNVITPSSASGAFETPVDATVEDGKELALFLRESLNLEKKCRSGFYSAVYGRRYGINLTLNKFNEILEGILNQETLKTINEIGSLHTSCGAMYETLKIRYNGELVFCPNNIHKMELEDLNEEADDYLIRKSLLENNYYNKADDENYDKTFYRHEVLRTSAFYSYFVKNAKLMFYLSRINQIDPIYIHNEKKLLQDALIITFLYTCPDANIQESGSLFGKSVDNIKFYCNGAIQYMEPYFKRIQEMKLF